MNMSEKRSPCTSLHGQKTSSIHPEPSVLQNRSDQEAEKEVNKPSEGAPTGLGYVYSESLEKGQDTETQQNRGHLWKGRVEGGGNRDKYQTLGLTSEKRISQKSLRPNSSTF